MAGSSSLTRSLSTASLVDSVAQYSTSEVAELVGLKATQVRHYVRRNLLTPLRGRRGEFRFSFQDVVMLRSAKELLDADVPVRRANRVLLDLKARNAQVSRPLSSMRVQAEGTRVVVQEGNKAWDAESGQGSLPFMFDAPDATADTQTTNKIASFSILNPDVDAGLGTEGASLRDPFADLPPDATTGRDEIAGFAEFTSHVEGQSNASDAQEGSLQQDQMRRDAALKLLETLRLSGLTTPDFDLDVDTHLGTDEVDTHLYTGIDAANKNKSEEVGEAHVAETESSADRQTQGAQQQPTDRPPELSQLSSDDWYNLALDLEEADPDKAPPAYRQALAINPQNTDAQVNLGRLCQLQGNLKQARRHYKLALGHAPEHQLANYNMGTIYDELDEFETARDYYVRAKDIPDAHYNLARLFEVQGDELAALRHMKEYRRLLEADISGR